MCVYTVCSCYSNTLSMIWPFKMCLHSLSRGITAVYTTVIKFYRKNICISTQCFSPLFLSSSPSLSLCFCLFMPFYFLLKLSKWPSFATPQQSFHCYNYHSHRTISSTFELFSSLFDLDEEIDKKPIIIKLFGFFCRIRLEIN